MSRPRRLCALARCLSLLLVGASALTVRAQAATPAPIVFEAPAGLAVAGATSATDAFSRILPSGRLLHPTGSSVVTGMNALGLTLAPGGRYAIVSNDDERQAATTSLLDPLTNGGYSLAVIDTRSMHIVSRYSQPGETYFVGVVALRDPVNAGNTLVLAAGGGSNAVYALDLDALGHLSPDAHHTIALPTTLDPSFADSGKAFPSAIVLGPGAKRAYVVDNLSDDVAQIDPATRSVVGAPVNVGFFPLAAALGSTGLLVANEGLMRYTKLAAPSGAPPFATPASDLERASSLSVVAAYGDGSLASGSPVAVPLDRGRDGVRQIGGAHPAAVAALGRKPYAFVAMSDVDRVATISLAGRAPRAVGGTELRLYDRGPYGTQPRALALGRDGKRLYVALAGIDAIAVLDTTDPVHPHRVGLIPTGWFPDALALSGDGRYLFVANAKGMGSDRGFTGDRAGIIDARGRVESVLADSNAVWSTLERIDLTKVDLRRTTPLALSYLRTIHAARKDAVVPQRFVSAGSAAIKHVVLVLEESQTYDAVLGDLKDAAGAPYGPGDPSYVAFDESRAPNLHALARTFALAGNIYADADETGAGYQFLGAGIASTFTEATRLVREGRRPLAGANQDPEDYPRAGYIFDSLAERGLTYRDYGAFLRLSGYDGGAAPDPKTDDPAYAGPADSAAPTQGLGGVYALDAPALASLGGHVDLHYPGMNPRIRNVRRAAEFVRDFDALVKADNVPALTLVALPNGGAAPSGSGAALADDVADGDRALGRIVDYLTHTPQWSSTAILIVPVDAQSSRDHVDVHRTYAVVVSPFAKHHVVGMRHLSTVSVLKTAEELLGLPALSLGDALATDMSDLFTAIPDPTPYRRVDAGI